MSYTVGFDLGTHQTKICIQDASNPAEKVYEFLEFEKPDGETTVLFPSIVQINKDHTISYGFYDEDDCLYRVPPVMETPELNLIPLPKLEIPNFNEQINELYNERPKAKRADIDNLDNESTTPLELWVGNCEVMNIRFIKEWKENCLDALRTYLSSLKDTLHKNVLNMADYEVSLEKARIYNQPYPLRFRYFKQAALTSPDIWMDDEFSSEEISVWYITYILLALKNRFGDDFSVQFGVPCGASNTATDKSITFNTYRLFIAAADLADQFENIGQYLSATYEELRDKTVFKTLTRAIIDEYYFDDIPEAFAGLVSVTKQKRLGMGFHLLVDIGGTTDFALFTVTKDLTPNVHSVASMPYGLNYIFEIRQQDINRSLEMIQNDFFKHPTTSQFDHPVKKYKTKLKKEGDQIWKSIFKAFCNSYSHHGMKMSKLKNALKLQPIIYCGGGSMFSNLHITIGDFTDLRCIDKELLDIRNLKNADTIEESLYPILSISYGLASFEKDYEGKFDCVKLSKVFQTFLPKVDQRSLYDRYEHGLSDIE